MNSLQPAEQLGEYVVCRAGLAGLGAGGLPCWEVGCHLSLEGWAFVGVIGCKLVEQ